VSGRLAVLAALVPWGLPVADVGTDHGLLVRDLLAAGRVPRAVAIDISGAALERARPALLGLGAELRRGDGLACLVPGEVATVVIAGMGGYAIRRILDGDRGVLAQVRRLVLGPHRDVTAVRAWLRDHAWDLADERLVEERGHAYVVLAAEPSSGPPAWGEADLAFGPLLRRRREPAFLAWLCREEARMRAVLSALPADHADRDGIAAELRRVACERAGAG
jgi:tRNA (adenine22-N1)-methyltransferase